jgi:hypothetical protein
MPIVSENQFPHVVLAEQGDTPATPATGLWRVYTKADGLYLVDDAGAVTGPLGPMTGTAFPGAPATGARFRRSDLDYQVFFYDGTRWLSEQMFTIGMSWSALTATAAYRVPVHTDLPVYVVDAPWVMRVEGVGNWDIDIQTVDLEGDVVTLASANVTASTDTTEAGTISIGSVVDASGGNVENSIRGLVIRVEENSGVVSCYGGASVNYRMVAT